jgi:hypothetical protein
VLAWDGPVAVAVGSRCCRPRITPAVDDQSGYSFPDAVEQQGSELVAGVRVAEPGRPEDRAALDRGMAGQNFWLALAPCSAPLVEPHMNPLVRGSYLRDPLLTGSGSKQQAEYRSGLEKQASVMTGAGRPVTRDTADRDAAQGV